MAASLAGMRLWAAGVVFMTLPHLIQGLLSDYKICGDPECESLMSRVQAIRDYHAKDCRFLSFRRGDTIFVYHKLTGKRDDLWAGSIDKQFGHFPKDAVKEEEVYATVEKVVETQKSDFFCMDEFDYPIDSSHLDADNDDAPKIQNQDSETAQTSQHTNDNNPQSQTSEDPSAESLTSAQEVEGKNNNGDDHDHAARIHEEEHAGVGGSEQGGSQSSSWLGSSVTGWLGLAEEGEPGNLVGGEEQDESNREASLMSSVTGWLGFGGEAIKPKEEESETADSLTSAMTGWLGFGGERKTDHSKEEMKRDEEREKEEEYESGETFRSRRIALDSNQLYEEEGKETGTLDWLGNGLSSTLGFGLTNQESGSKKTGDESEVEKTIPVEEPPASSSWLDLGIQDILGFRKDVGGIDETTESGFKETEEDKTAEKVLDAKEDEGNDLDTKERETNIADEPLSAKPETEIHQLSLNKLTGNETEGKDSETGEETDIIPAAVLNYTDLTSNSVRRSVGEDEEDYKDQLQSKTSETVDEDGRETTNQTHDTEESSEASVESGAEGDDDDEAEGGKAETGGLHRDADTFYTIQTNESAHQTEVSGDEGENSSETEQLSSPSGSADDKTDHVTKDNGFTPDSVKTNSDDSDTAVNDTETEETPMKQEVSGSHAAESLYESSSEEFETPHSANRSTEIQYENVSEEVKGGFASNESMPDQDVNTDNTNQASSQQQTAYSDDDDERGTDEEAEKERDNIFQPAQTEEETLGSETETETNHIKSSQSDLEIEIPESSLHSQHDAAGPPSERKDRETKAEESEGLAFSRTASTEGNHVPESLQMEDETREPVEEVKRDERLKEMEELKEEETQEEVKDLQEEMKQDDVEEEMRKEEGDKQEEVGDESLALIKSRLNEDLSVEGSDELHPQAVEVGSVKHTEGGKYTENELSSGEKSTKEAEKLDPVNDRGQMLSEMTGESQKIPSESKDAKERDIEGVQEKEKMEKDKEEKTNDGEKSDEDEEAQQEIKAGGSNVTVDEGHDSFDHTGTDIDQTGQIHHGDDDQACGAETGQQKTPGQAVCQTAEHKQDDRLYSREEEIVDLCNNCGKTEIKDNDPSESSDHVFLDEITTRIHSDDKGETVEGVNEKHERANIKDDHVTVTEDADMSTMNDESKIKVGGEIPASLSEAVISEQISDSNDPTDSSGDSQDQSGGTAKPRSGGTFGLFENAFSFFSPTPITETKDSTDPAPSWDTRTGEQSSLPLKQELDSCADSTVVNNHDLHPNSPASALPQQLQPSPSFTETQESSPSPAESLSHVHSLSPNTDSPLKTKAAAATLSKHYKNLLSHMSADETAVVIELFGRHKLQWLDYILGSSDTVIEDRDHDESILMDVERLLDYHREMLITPSVRLADAPREDDERTRTLVALQKLEMLLARVREAFSTGKSAVSKTNHEDTAEASCVSEPCATHSKDREKASEEEPRKTGDSSAGHRDEGMGKKAGGEGEEWKTEMEKAREMVKGNKEERGPPAVPDVEMSRPHTQPGPQPQEGVMKQMLDFVHQTAKDSATEVHAMRKIIMWLIVQVVLSLPDDMRPGPDLYGLPWEPVIICGLVGVVTMLLFSCRCYSSVKSRMYRIKERQMAEIVAQLLDEKCEVLKTFSKCQQEYDILESSLRNSGVLAQTEKIERLEAKARQLEHSKREMDMDLEQLMDQLKHQREHRMEQEKKIAALEDTVKKLEEETKDLQSQEEQAQTTLKVYIMNSDRLQKKLETAEEENNLLNESNTQLRQQVEGWAERVNELDEEMRRCEVVSSGTLQDVATKDERIMSLTDLILLRMRAWDSDLGEEEGKETTNGKAGGREENEGGDTLDTQVHIQKVQKLIYAAKLNADLKSVDEDKDRVFAKLNDEVKAKEDLHEGIKELEKEKLSLQSEAEHFSEEVQRLQQKLQIMTEMYQENELKLHRLLTVEEKERLQKEEKLNKADRNIALAMEELNNYRERAEEMEEEVEKTKQSYQTQISAHEKKAHNNWLAARAAERDLADIRRESALLRQKLTDTQFKLDSLDKEPYSLDSLSRPLPFRGERSPYGPSPLGRPASETRAFLSPPTLMEGPPSRLSPRASRGPGEPPGGQGEMERSGGPHSDSGSISPTWDRDRRPPPPRGPPGPAGYMFQEPGGPMYRRPLPPPGALGPLPPPGSMALGPPPPRGFPSTGPLPPGPPHPADMADGAYRENSENISEQEHRESGPGDRRTPPEADRRMEDVPHLGPIDGPFPRRAPYGPPPPDFYPFRGPGGPPMVPTWGPPRPPHPGMMCPPRFPPGGPLPPPAPHPHMPPYGAPPMRPPPSDGLPPPSMGPPLPRQRLPTLPHGQFSAERTPSPQDAI